MDMKLEVVLVPVSDVDRAKAFYGSLGWRLDADFPGEGGFRVVQFTPPGSHDAGGVFHHAGGEARTPGAAPDHKSYGSFASFSDPDGNGWFLQEVTTRLPGR